MCGDGGWRGLAPRTAEQLAHMGFAVAGVGTKVYLRNFSSLQTPLSFKQLANDYVEIAKAARDYKDLLDAALKVRGIDTKKPVVLSGWSLGAGYSVLAVALSTEVKNLVGRLVVISLPIQNELAWKPTDAIIYVTHGVPREEIFEATNYMSKLGPVPFVLINATDDTMATMKDAQWLFNKVNGPKLLMPVKANDHRYKGNESEFFNTLDQSLRMNV